MIKYLTILFVCILCGCTASHKDVTEEFSLPKELQEYKVVRLENTAGIAVYILVRKNNEDRPVIGTTQAGKNPGHTVIIDDVEYTRK